MDFVTVKLGRILGSILFKDFESSVSESACSSLGGSDFDYKRLLWLELE